MILTAAAPVRRRSSTFPPLPSSPQHVESMAMALDNLCPICLHGWKRARGMMSCLQQFCYTCILWWAETKSKCPPCKRKVTFLHLDNGFEEHVFRTICGVNRHLPPSRGSFWPTSHPQMPSAVGIMPGDPVGSFHPHAWVSLLHVYPALLWTLLP